MCREAEAHEASPASAPAAPANAAGAAALVTNVLQGAESNAASMGDLSRAALACASTGMLGLKIGLL